MANATRTTRKAPREGKKNLKPYTQSEPHPNAARQQKQAPKHPSPSRNMMWVLAGRR